MILDSAHAGASSTSSVALTESVTATIAWFGGDTLDGVAVSALMTGAVTSGGTVTLTDDEAALPDPSTQVSLNVYVLPPTALTVPVFAPVTLKSAGDEPGPVMLASVHVGASPESSVAAADVVTVTVWPFGGQMVDGVAVRLVNTGAVVSGGTTTSTDLLAALPAASLHRTVNV